MDIDIDFANRDQILSTLDHTVAVLKNNKKHNGIANIGYRPTFNQKKLLLEVNIFNFSKNIYNKKLKVEFISFIRDKFYWSFFDHISIMYGQVRFFFLNE